MTYRIALDPNLCWYHCESSSTSGCPTRLCTSEIFIVTATNVHRCDGARSSLGCAFCSAVLLYKWLLHKTPPHLPHTLDACAHHPKFTIATLYEARAKGSIRPQR